MKKNRRHRNHGLQGLALLLSIVLLFVFMPLSSVAEVLGQLDVEEEPVVEEIYEVTALREESVKHFYVGEGNYTAVSYGEAVHRLDAVGTWQEIDNTLTLQNGKYQTSDGRVQLAGTAGEDLLQLSEKGYRIGLSFATGGADNTAPYALQSVNTANATVQNVTREPVLEGDSAAVKYEKISKVLNRSGLQYTNLLANTDVAYTLHGNDITGRITLRGQRGSNDVALRLQLTGLVPTLAADGSILLADATTEEVAYTIPAPTASDPNLTASYQLVPVSEGLYLLGITTTLRDHISTEDFGSLTTPGSGDTAVTLSFGVVTLTRTIYDFGPDTCGYIDRYYPNADLRHMDEMYFQSGYDVSTVWYYDQVGYLWVDLPQIPQGTVCTEANLSMWYNPIIPIEDPPLDPGDVEACIDVYKASAAWYEAEEWTYFIADEYYGIFGVGEYITEEICWGSGLYFDFDVYSAVLDWYGGEAYHGFAVLCKYLDAPFYVNNTDYSPSLAVTYQYDRLADGVYFIQNQQYSTFLSNSGQSVSMQDFAATDAQLWRITHVVNDFYEISSLDDTKVLTASGSTAGSGVSMMSREAASSDNYFWYITIRDDGIRFTPLATHLADGSLNRYCVCLGVTQTGTTSTIQMLENPTQAGGRVWELYSLDNTVNVNVYYDHAYVTRYGNTTNSTNTAANAVVQARINGHMRALQFKYLTEFGIFINCSTPQLIACYGCTLSNENHTETCECTTRCAQSNASAHHYNINYIGYKLRLEYSLLFERNTSLSVCFIGHNYCYFKNGHKTPFGEGSTDAYLNGVAYYVNSGEQEENDITNIEGLVTIHNFQSELRERSTVIHEFGHLFLAPDHYDDGILDDSDYCIYGDYKANEDIVNSTTICTGCKRIIQQNKTRFDYLKARSSVSE